MATKDYVYLALIAFAAVVFYLHGYFAGRAAKRNRTRHQAAKASAPMHLPEPVVFTISVDDLNDSRHQPANRLREHEVRSTVQCVFGHN